MSYTQLAQDERYAIYFMNKRGEAKTTIAEELGQHKSTIYRELNRDKGKRE